MDITVKIAGTEYKLRVDSPEAEQNTRMAVQEINTMLAKYDTKFVDRTLADKLVFVCLYEAKTKLQYKNKLTDFKAETDQLKGEVEAYLKGIEK